MSQWANENPEQMAEIAALPMNQQNAALRDAKGVEDQLASLPGKDELRAKLLATLQAPLQNFVVLLQAPAQNFVYALSARKDQQ